MSNRLTLDYGVRFVHQQPQYDIARAGVELPAGQVVDRPAPRCLRRRLRQRRLPVLGHEPAGDESASPAQLLGPNTAAAIGTLVPNSGNTLNGLFLSGQGIAETTYTVADAGVGAALRRGVRPDRQAEDRPARRRAGCSSTARAATRSMPGHSNPPTLQNVTVRYAQLQTLGAAA